MKPVDPALNATRAVTREARIKGIPSLSSYVDYCEDRTVDPVLDRRALISEWTQANALYERLQREEAGAPNTIQTWPIEADLEPAAAALRADERFAQTFGQIRTRFAWVEIDKLVVSQKSVDLDHCARLAQKLEGPRDANALFDFAMPRAWSDAPVTVKKRESGRYVISSKSSDLRYHRSHIFQGEDVKGYEGYGAVAAVVGLVVGFGSNFLNVVEGNGRMVIYNGHHRAFALRAAGVTHAPCLVQSAEHIEELEMIVTGDIAKKPAFYFQMPRPPMLRDFFNPDLRKDMIVTSLTHAVEITYTAREYFYAEGEES